MKNILIVSGHPDLNQSLASATILDEVATALPDAEMLTREHAARLINPLNAIPE